MTTLQIIVIVFWSLVYLIWGWFSINIIKDNNDDEVEDILAMMWVAFTLLGIIGVSIEAFI